MTYDSENLFSGIRLVSQEEMRETTPIEKKPIDDDTSNDDTTPIDMYEPDYETENPSPFSLVQPNREANTSDDSEEDDASDDISTKVDDIEEEKNLDVKAQKYLALAKELQAEGILSELNEEDFDPSLDGLKKLFNDEKTTRVQSEVENFKKSFSGAKKTFLEIEDAFDSEVQAIQVAKKLDFYKTINESALEGNDSLAKQIYGESLKLAGFSDERIAEEIQDAEDLGKLQDKASKSIKGITSYYDSVVEKGRAQIKAREAEYAKKEEENFNSLVGKINEKEHVIKGLPYTKAHKEKLQERMMSPVYTDKNGVQYTELGYKQHKNTQEFEILVNYYDQLGLFNMDKDGNFNPDLSKLKNIAKSTATHELDKIIEQEEANSKSKKGMKRSEDISRATEDIIAKLDRARGR